MKIVPTLYGLFEGRIASPAVRRVSHIVEKVAESLAWWRARNRKVPANLKDRFCSKPFDHFELLENGSVYLCCPRWLSWRAGNILGQNAAEIWNSPSAQAIRRGILDGSFSHCNHGICPVIQAGTLPTRSQAMRDPRLRDIIANNRTVIEEIPRLINFSHDKSCNLSCPSCRTQRILHTEGEGYETRKSLQDRLIEAFFSKPSDQPFTISITGTGDPFASRVFREFLYSFDGRQFPNVRVNLQTNGVLFTKRSWERLHKLRGKIEAVLVSFDAATPETYAVTRRGGHWEQLLENVEFLAQLRRDGEIGSLAFYFVVQQANFREMPAMVEIGRRHGVDQVNFSKAVWWGTWSMAEMKRQRVWQPENPDYAEFASMIVDPVFDDPIVFLGNLVPERSRILALGSGLRSKVIQPPMNADKYKTTP